MRYENNKGYGQDDTRKKNFRYTMIAILCVCVVAVAAVFTIRANPKWVARNDDTRIDLKDNIQEDLGKGQDVVKPVPTVDSKNNPQSKGSEGAAKQNQGQQRTASEFLLPLEGGTLGESYSKEIPIYSKTLDQYAVHEGVDIEGATDAPVLAAADGTVTKVYTDDKLGTAIELTHGNGVVTRYCNLSTTKMVEEGDVVKKGDVISGVGNTALFESLDPPHLHFEVIKDGSTVDPSLYVTLPEKQVQSQQTPSASDQQ